MAFNWFKSQLLKAISWEDNTNNTIVYKFPMDGKKIMYGSKLTVRESQVAIFMDKGEIADIFGPGMHKLETSNLPILTSLQSWGFGFNSPFESDVYFISTKQFINQKWGTSNPFVLKDKDFGTLRVRGYGSYSFKVDDPKVLLKELFGSNSTFTTEDVADYIKSMLISSISDTISESKIPAVELAANYAELNKEAAQHCEDSLKNIGLKLTNFIIENLSFPEEVEKAIDSSSSINVLDGKMTEYMKYQSAQAVKDSANNPNGGNFSNAGIGIGAGVAFGEILRNSMREQPQAPAAAPAEKPAKETAKKFCSNCGAEMKKTAKFCPECGTKQEAANVCPNCGAELPKSAKFCPECGTKK